MSAGIQCGEHQGQETRQPRVQFKANNSRLPQLSNSDKFVVGIKLNHEFPINPIVRQKRSQHSGRKFDLSPVSGTSDHSICHPLIIGEILM